MMETQQTTIIQFLRLPKENSGKASPGQLAGEKLQDQLEDAGEGVLCRQCRSVITLQSERISVQGSHQHTFANPQGYVYQIGCFRSAHGCGYTGQLTAEWSWFSGFRWRIALCSSCLIQLGWLFVATSGERFNGLIIDRLVFPEEARFEKL